MVCFRGAISEVEGAARGDSSPYHVRHYLLLPGCNSRVVRSRDFTGACSFNSCKGRFVASMVSKADRLISCVCTRATAIVRCSVTLHPSRVRVISVAFMAVVGSCLPVAPVVFRLPVQKQHGSRVSKFIQRGEGVPTVSIGGHICDLCFRFCYRL